MKILSFVFIFCAAALCGAWFLSNGNSGEVQNSLTVYPQQYSDRTITEEAKKKDERFAGLSFNEPKEIPGRPVGSQLASIFDILSWLFPEKPDPFAQNEYGAWIWTPTMQMTNEYMDEILSELSLKNVNTIYLSIDSYLDIYALSDRNEKRAKEKEFADKLSTFILKAKRNGMAVDAEAGWKNWAEDGHTYKPLAIVNFVKRYNETAVHKFRGFQYDVEPYLLDEFQQSEEGKKEVLARFTKLIDQTADILAVSQLEFSVVVPDFYDKKDEMVPVFSYAGEKKSAFEHVLRVLEKVPKSSVVIMSYRNFAEGKDGSIEISKNEMKTAQRGRYDSRVVIAQETGDFPPAYITFHSKPLSYFDAEISKLRAAFFSNPNFGGIAVHYANAFVALGN